MTCMVLGSWASLSSARNYVREGQALMAQVIGQQSVAQRNLLAALLLEGDREFYE